MAANSSINTGNFDPFNNQWNSEDLSRTQLRIEGDLTNLDERVVRIMYEKLPTPLYGSSVRDWCSSVVSGAISIVTGDQDPTSLYNIKRAFDSIVKRELKEENEQINNLVSGNLPIDVCYTITNNILRKLTNLQANLISHNSVITAYNARFFLVDGYSNHNENLDAIHKQIERIRTIKASLMDDLAKVAEKRIENLQDNINNGMKINKGYLINDFPFFMSFISTIEPPLKQKELRNHYQMIINQAYIANVIDQIKNRKIEIPTSIYEILSSFGLHPEFVQIQLSLLSTDFIDSLNELFKLDNFSEISPLTIKDKLESHLIALIVKDKDLISPPLNDEQRKQLGIILIKLNNFENKYISNYQDLLRPEKENIITKIKSEERRPFIKKQIIASIQSYNPDFNARPALSEILNGKRTERVILDSSPENFESFMKILDESISIAEDKQIRDIKINTSEKLKELLKTIESLKKNWFERNKAHQIFAFDQSTWGDNYVLDGGVCKAITYRWIKELLQNPDKPIRSQLDLNSDKTILKNQNRILENIKINKIQNNPIIAAAREKEKNRELATGRNADEFVDTTNSPIVTSATLADIEHINSTAGITIHDRMHQVKYELARRFNEGNALSMPEVILKQDKIKSTILTPDLSTAPSTMTEVIDYLATKNLIRSDGIVSLAVYQATKNDNGIIVKAENGHAMGIQIDFARNIYRFWDVNSGFYSYDDINELKRESEAYMKEFYNGEYNCFTITQYSPETS